MKTHTTNYENTFIEVAEDCPTTIGEAPPTKGDNKSVANLQFERLQGQPYRHNSDDVLFSVFAARKELPDNAGDEQRATFFSKALVQQNTQDVRQVTTALRAWVVEFRASARFSLPAVAADAGDDWHPAEILGVKRGVWR